MLPNQPRDDQKLKFVIFFVTDYFNTLHRRFNFENENLTNFKRVCSKNDQTLNLEKTNSDRSWSKSQNYIKKFVLNQKD